MTPESMTLLVDELIDDENEELSAYQDSEGYWTIGIGRMIDKRKGGGITKQESIYLCGNDIAKACGDLDRKLPWWRNLDDVRQRVLINMTFNMGIGVLGVSGLLGFTRTLALIRDGKYSDAADEMLKSAWAGEVKSRAGRLVLMMRTGQPRPGSVKPVNP